MIWTIVGGAAAFVVIVKFAVCPGGTVKNRTTVGPASGKPRSTVPVADAPPRTESGLIVSAPMLPAAEASPGSASSASSAGSPAGSGGAWGLRSGSPFE